MASLALLKQAHNHHNADQLKQVLEKVTPLGTC